MATGLLLIFENLNITTKTSISTTMEIEICILSLIVLYYLDYEDLSFIAIVSLVSFYALAIEWLIVSRCFAGGCIGLTVLF
jgi:hypothetical protein